MARNLFAILDDLTANLAELKAALAPLALIGGTVVSEARKSTSAQRRGKATPPCPRGPTRAQADRRRGRVRSENPPLGAPSREGDALRRARPDQRQASRRNARPGAVH